MNKFRILLLAYYYPPLGGPASIRYAKSIKYLAEEGFSVDVITLNNRLYHSIDRELEKECRHNEIRYVSSYDLPTLLYHFRGAEKRGNGSNNNSLYFSLPEKLRSLIKRILPVDDKLFWYWGAKKAAMKLMRVKKYDLICAGIGPYTAGLVGYSLSKKTSVPLLVDFRDHWTLNPYEKFLTPLHRYIAESLERKVISQASYLTCIGRTMQEELVEKYSRDLPDKKEIIYNGYDEEDFNNGKQRETCTDRTLSCPYSDKAGCNNKDKHFTFIYTGNFYLQRTPYYFCRALLSLQQQGKLSNNIRVVFVGNYHLEAKRIITDKKLAQIVELLPYKNHRETVGMMMESDCLLLFIPSADGSGVLTSKIFEYLRTGKPILAMIPEKSEAAEFLDEKKDSICPPEDVDRIAEAIIKITGGNKSPSGAVRLNGRISCYSRQAQTKKLADMLRKK